MDQNKKALQEFTDFLANEFVDESSEAERAAKADPTSNNEMIRLFFERRRRKRCEDAGDDPRYDLTEAEKLAQERHCKVVDRKGKVCNNKLPKGRHWACADCRPSQEDPGLYIYHSIRGE